MSENKHAWSPLGEDMGIVASVRLDIAMMIEADLAPPPVLFRTFQLLEDWSGKHGLSIENIEGIKPASAVRVLGEYQSSEATEVFAYDQVWVRSTYSNYNKAMKIIALKGFDVDKAALEGTHADHVINRARLAALPDAWVLLFPVSKHANSPFGAIERLLQPIEASVDCVSLPSLIALKLFCGRLPKTSEELSHAMCDVRGHFLQTSPAVVAYCNEIESQARTYIRSQ